MPISLGFWLFYFASCFLDISLLRGPGDSWCLCCQRLLSILVLWFLNPILMLHEVFIVASNPYVLLEVLELLSFSPHLVSSLKTSKVLYHYFLEVLIWMPFDIWFKKNAIQILWVLVYWIWIWLWIFVVFFPVMYFHLQHFFTRFNLSVSCAIWSGLLLQLVFPLSAMFFGALKVLCSVMVGCHKVLCADYICSFQHHVFCKLRCRFADDSCSSCF